MDYIDRKKLDKDIQLLSKRHRLSSIVSYNIRRTIERAIIPVENVVEVKHGTWELKSESVPLIDDFYEDFYVECPLCHRREYVPFDLEEEKMIEYAKEHFPYC